jgi:hypothetical protein
MDWNKKIDELVAEEKARIGRFVGRARTCDDAFKFRMTAGFVGSVNRMHPATIEPCLIDASAPPTAYGQPVVVDATTQGVRPLVAGDSALTAIYGITVRPFPFQQSTGGMSASFNTCVPPVTGVIDVLRSGYILVQSNVTGVKKGGTVFIWVAATSGAHVQDQFEIVTSAGNTITLDAKSSYNGTEDANKVIELAFNI